MGLSARATKVLEQLALELPARDIRRLKQSAIAAQRLEVTWVDKLEDVLRAVLLELLERYEDGKGVPRDLPAIDDFFLEHTFAVILETFQLERVDDAQNIPDEKRAKLGRLPVGRVPTNSADLRRLWDYYRKKGKMPPRQEELARRVKRAFLDKAQEIFKKHSEDFRAGDVYDRKVAYDAMARRFAEPFARAKMTVETETTRYYNATRRQIYDASPDVTHYLFVAVRDHATTEWCKTRHGLVYAKGDPLLERETPPIHWNCRSEVLPLTMQNEQHKRMIENRKRWRRNNTCAPLPPGWNKP